MDVGEIAATGGFCGTGGSLHIIYNPELCTTTLDTFWQDFYDRSGISRCGDPRSSSLYNHDNKDCSTP